MQNFTELETNIKSIIDDLKGLCSTNGLSNTASEEIIVTFEPYHYFSLFEHQSMIKC